MQCIVVKSGDFENSYSLLYILLKSCLCCCSLRSNKISVQRWTFDIKSAWVEFLSLKYYRTTHITCITNYYCVALFQRLVRTVWVKSQLNQVRLFRPHLVAPWLNKGWTMLGHYDFLWTHSKITLVFLVSHFITELFSWAPYCRSFEMKVNAFILFINVHSIYLFHSINAAWFRLGKESNT